MRCGLGGIISEPRDQASGFADSFLGCRHWLGVLFLGLWNLGQWMACVVVIAVVSRLATMVWLTPGPKDQT